jgi:hypothetical protein
MTCSNFLFRFPIKDFHVRCPGVVSSIGFRGRAQPKHKTALPQLGHSSCDHQLHFSRVVEDGEVEAVVE